MEKIMITIRNIAIAFLLYFISSSTYAAEKELIVTVEQTAGTVGFYDPIDGKKYASVHVGFLPHEIAISKNKKTAYVSNFGLQDFDETIGVPGVSISVIDIPNHIEKYRLYTFDPSKRATFSQIDKAPHGVRLRPPFEKLLYVNVEKGNKILIFDVKTRKIVNKIDVNPHTHNFIFSPDGKVLWLMAGRNGVIRMDPDTGKITGRFTLTTPIRGLIYTPDTQYIMASGDNEIFLLNPKNLTVYKHFDNLGVTQILYSDMTPDKRYIIAPAVWDSQAIIIDTATGKVIKRVVTGLDPVTVRVSQSGKFAYVTNARDDFLTEIDLTTFQTKNILTGNGSNGLAITKFTSPRQHKTLTLGVPLPLSGNDSAKGREMMLGYELWRSSIRQAGGLIIQDIPYNIKIIYLDTQSNNLLLRILTKELITKNHINIFLGTYGEEAYKIEKEIAMNNHIPIAPLLTQAFEWKPNNLATGEDFFITTNRFDQEFQLYYNLKATWLSAAAVESVIILQQALLKINSFNYDSLMETFSTNHFQTFLSGLVNVVRRKNYAN
jgi:DNA-binding beta-propeller fold protein YncE